MTTTSAAATVESVLEAVRGLAERFASERRERQRRRELDPADFQAIRDTGFPLLSLPVEHGGLWVDVARSTRPIAEALRLLAAGDASVALVASMHPAVMFMVGWLTPLPTSPGARAAWEAQRQWVFNTVRDGAQWGTITSEPGSGGDILKTRSVARPTGKPGEYRLSGDKHFGSGSGVTHYMITTALPEGETTPALFFLDVRDAPWDGSTGMTLTAPWDGQGMAATQSHAMRFDDYPATRIVTAGPPEEVARAPRGLINTLWVAITLALIEAAVGEARQRLQGRRDELRPFERVEWTRAVTDAWLARQAYEGMLRSTEQDAGRDEFKAKTAVAELAESILPRLSRVVGGGAYSRYSPLGFWLEDVRALGFLRPPWGLAYDELYTRTWPT
jgi:alkylation response protein AidB-like acyl-CoA dehydrogenase